MENNNSLSLWDLLQIKDKNCEQSLIDKLFIQSTQTKECRLAWRILRDPFYRDLYNQWGSVDKVISAGFFDNMLSFEEVTKEHPTSWLTTPIQKIKNNLNHSENNRPFVVLLSTGAFSPIHSGHVKMMELAKEELELMGYEVLGGYISPSHDAYVSKKNNGQSACNISSRIFLCEKALANHPWLMVDPWEGLYSSTAINFTDVILRLNKYLSTHVKTKKPIEIAYIFGGDNANFSLSFINQGISVCVDRIGSSEIIFNLKNEPKINQNPKIRFIHNSPYSDISSTKIRAGNTKHVIKKTSTANTHNYIIRNDETLSIANWIITCPQLIESQKIFLINLIKEIKQAFFGKIRIYNQKVNDQVSLIKKRRTNLKTLSLDLYIHGNYNLEVSRVFSLSSDQFNPNYITNRPLRSTLADQVKQIPEGNYCIIEDDIASGSTMNFIKNLLPNRVTIIDQIILSKLTKPSKFLDIVDLRDFIVGSRDGGLVVQLPNGEIARAPYVLPYVSLKTRAKIPEENELILSYKIWVLNHNFFKNTNISLKDSDSSFQKLMNYIGFSNKTSMEKICSWHINQLKPLVDHESL
jgi:nicotinic acid mononucleotide adenylyltransferase